jgi:Tfp pilus assembly protein FimT
MVIIVLFTGMMTPSLISFYAESRLRSGLRSLVAQCQYARDQAVSRNVAVRVNWDVEEGTHFITVEQTEEDSLSPASGTRPQVGEGDQTGETEFVPEQTDLGGVHTLPVGVSYAGLLTRESSDEAPTFVTFTPDGRAEDLAILLENTRGTRRAVAIEAITGRCQVTDAEGLEKAGFGELES